MLAPVRLGQVFTVQLLCSRPERRGGEGRTQRHTQVHCKEGSKLLGVFVQYPRHQPQHVQKRRNPELECTLLHAGGGYLGAVGVLSTERACTTVEGTTALCRCSIFHPRCTGRHAHHDIKPSGEFGYLFHSIHNRHGLQARCCTGCLSSFHALLSVKTRS